MNQKTGIIFAVLIALFSLNVFGEEEKTLKEIARQKAREKVVQELEDELSKRLGHPVSAENYIQAMNHFSHGEVEEGKNLATELVLGEMFKIVIGSSFTSVVSAAWEFDKWVWDSVQKWGHDRRKDKFVKEFLNPRLKVWFNDKDFGIKQAYMLGFTKKLSGDFDQFINDEIASNLNESSGTLYHLQKEENRKFKVEMWEVLLQSVGRVISVKRKLKEESDRALSILRARMNKYQEEYLKSPNPEVWKKPARKKGPKIIKEPGIKKANPPVNHSYQQTETGSDVGRIESEFRSLYPSWLRSRDDSSQVTTVLVNARKGTDGKYFISIETKCTNNQGQSWICSSRDMYMTLGDLRKNIELYKKDLGMR